MCVYPMPPNPRETLNKMSCSVIKVGKQNQWKRETESMESRKRVNGNEKQSQWKRETDSMEIKNRFNGNEKISLNLES